MAVDEYPLATIGSIVSFYPNSDDCEVEVGDDDGYPIDVITYETKKLEVF